MGADGFSPPGKQWSYDGTGTLVGRMSGDEMISRIRPTLTTDESD